MSPIHYIQQHHPFGCARTRCKQKRRNTSLNVPVRALRVESRGSLLGTACAPVGGSRSHGAERATLLFQHLRACSLCSVERRFGHHCINMSVTKTIIYNLQSARWLCSFHPDASSTIIGSHQQMESLDVSNAKRGVKVMSPRAQEWVQGGIVHPLLCVCRQWLSPLAGHNLPCSVL